MASAQMAITYMRAYNEWLFEPKRGRKEEGWQKGHRVILLRQQQQQAIMMLRHQLSSCELKNEAATV
jgi:hypothetical protein